MATAKKNSTETKSAAPRIEPEPNVADTSTVAKDVDTKAPSDVPVHDSAAGKIATVKFEQPASDHGRQFWLENNDSLKAAAKEFQRSNCFDADVVKELPKPEIVAKCSDAKAAALVVARIINFLTAGQDLVFTGGLPKQIATSPTVELSLVHLFPSIIAELALDIANTVHDKISITEKHATLAKNYLDAFAHQDLIRFDLNWVEEETPLEMQNLQGDIITAQHALVQFLKLVVKHTKEFQPHTVVIEMDLTIQIDGKVQVLKEQCERGLLVLAKLHKDDVFSVNQFAELYCNDETEAKKPFDTVMNAVRQRLPNLDWKAEGGDRRIQNVRFIVNASEDAVTKQLARFYKKK